VVVVAGPGTATAEWDPDGRLDLSAYAPPLPPLSPPTGQPGLPPALGLGALLLDQAGYTGRRVLQAVDGDEPPAACASLGARLAAGPRTALLAMGDGSARRTTAAPGYLDERAVPFDLNIERAVRAGDLTALAGADPALARELMASGRPAWQLLAGALGPRAATEVLYADAPFGVSYLVALFTPGLAGR
jgi:hypothetical protein